MVDGRRKQTSSEENVSSNPRSNPPISTSGLCQGLPVCGTEGQGQLVSADRDTAEGTQIDLEEPTPGLLGKELNRHMHRQVHAHKAPCTDGVRQHQGLDRQLVQMGNVPDRWSRRLLRIAVHSRDVVRIRHLTSKGIDVNMVISDVFCDTALTYSVKYGYLEIVEILAILPSCRIDQLDRNNHSALDEAIKAWLVGAIMPSEVRPNLGRRFRIIRCLLEAGASQISVNFLDMVVFSTLSSPGGFELIGKLVRLFCEKGCVHVKSTLLSVIVFYRGTASMINSLVASAALPVYYVKKNPAQLTMPMDNALVILRACAQVEILRRIDADTSSSLECIEKHWTSYLKILRLFTLAGYSLQMFILNYLYRCHADVYRWVVHYNTNPKPLLHLVRNTIRKQVAANVSFALTSLDIIPDSMKLYLLYSDV